MREAIRTPSVVPIGIAGRATVEGLAARMALGQVLAIGETNAEATVTGVSASVDLGLLARVAGVKNLSDAELAIILLEM